MERQTAVEEVKLPVVAFEAAVGGAVVGPGPAVVDKPVEEEEDVVIGGAAVVSPDGEGVGDSPQDEAAEETPPP